jgi:hypothetical protein
MKLPIIKISAGAQDFYYVEVLEDVTPLYIRGRYFFAPEGKVSTGIHGIGLFDGLLNKTEEPVSTTETLEEVYFRLYGAVPHILPATNPTLP